LLGSDCTLAGHLDVITGKWENSGDCRKLQRGTKMERRHPRPPCLPPLGAPSTKPALCLVWDGIAGPDVSLFTSGKENRERRQREEPEEPGNRQEAPGRGAER